MAIGMCTIISKNYISLARTLVDSYLHFHPDGKAFLLLVDENKGEILPENERFTFLNLQSLGIPNLKSFCFKYDITELNTAVKPFFIEHLFKEFQLEKILYFDPDILITDSLSSVYDLLNEHSIILTPHIISPMVEDHARPSEIDLLKAGVFNLGFIGLKNCNSVKNFLIWWKKRLYNHCLIDIEDGLFVDQRWIDLVPGMFEDTCILRDPSYNVAYWNLHERKLSVGANGYLVNNKPLVFYHFSGFKYDLSGISRHQNRFSWSDIPCLLSLYELYKDKIIENGYLETRNLVYEYNYFDNGMKVSNLIRRIYYSLGMESEKLGDPFKTSGVSFYKWLMSPDTFTKIPRLVLYIYKNRPDLKKAFPNIPGSDNQRLIRWAKSSLEREYRIKNKYLIF